MHHGQQGRQKTTRFCDYFRKNGQTQNWCRKKMRDEEIRKVRFVMPPKKHIAAIEDNSAGILNCRPQNDLTVNHSLDPCDKNNSKKELLSNDEGNWENEADQVTPPE